MLGSKHHGVAPGGALAAGQGQARGVAVGFTARGLGTPASPSAHSP